MIKMFLDDSLHHTYNYVDQPFTYPGPLSHINSVWVAMPLFAIRLSFVYSLLQLLL